jgi:hypothetical protein
MPPLLPHRPALFNTSLRQILRILKRMGIIRLRHWQLALLPAFAPSGSRIPGPPFGPQAADISLGAPACCTTELAPMPPGVRMPLSFRGTLLLRVGLARLGGVHEMGPVI